MTCQLLGHTAEEQPFQLSSSTLAYNDEIDLLALRKLQKKVYGISRTSSGQNIPGANFLRTISCSLQYF